MFVYVYIDCSLYMVTQGGHNTGKIIWKFSLHGKHGEFKSFENTGKIRYFYAFVPDL